MGDKKRNLVTGQVYHILNRSIAGFKIFNNDADYMRMLNAFRFYRIESMPCRFARFIEMNNIQKGDFSKHFIPFSQGKEKNVQIIAYCIMSTHFHLILKQTRENGISTYISNVLNSYTRYFNIKYKRKGPLWQSKFKDVLVKTDEQLIHLTRYIHLNPVTAYLVDKPEDWPMSSYKEYLLENDNEDRICDYRNLLDIKPSAYKQFTEDNIAYQRDLTKIKELFLD